MPRAAEIAESRCTCGHRFTACFLASENWAKPCPKCGADCSPMKQPVQRNYGNRVFTDTMSRQFGFHPDEVREVRAMLGPIGNCIRDDGEVHFQDRQQEREFRETYVRVRAANEARERERVEQLAEDPEEQDARETVREMAVAAGRDPDEVMDEIAEGQNPFCSEEEANA